MYMFLKLLAFGNPNPPKIGDISFGGMYGDTKSLYDIGRDAEVDPLFRAKIDIEDALEIGKKILSETSA